MTHLIDAGPSFDAVDNVANRVSEDGEVTVNGILDGDTLNASIDFGGFWATSGDAPGAT